MVIEEQLEQALRALEACDPIEAARWLEGPHEGPATPRARALWEQCMTQMPRVMADWQRRVAAYLATRTYAEHGE